MSPRIICVAMLTSLVAASSCAIEASAPSDSEVGSQKSTLTTGGGGEVKKVDPTGGFDETTAPENPIPGDPGSIDQAGGDPGKPSPDPWIRPASQSKDDPIVPGGVDPIVQTKQK